MTGGRRVDLGAWREHLIEPFRGRRVILGFKVLAAMTAQVEQLRRWGGPRPLLIARGTGAGPQPPADDAETLVLDIGQAASGTDELRRLAAIAADPPPEVVQRVTEYDPERSAVWWLDSYCESPELLGRPVFGGRRPEWTRLEDKTRCDEIWDAAGVPRAAARVVPARDRDLLAASEQVGGADGVVWSGDAASGVNGDGEYVRWIKSESDARAAAEFFAARCDRVRVMPFLEGVPCSIHGMVLDDGVAVFRPVELVTLRRADVEAFVFAGMSTWWDPPKPERRAMRQAARRVGALLAERVDYRGGFNIDGVLTPDGFRPTELNSRFSTAMSAVYAELPLELVHLNVVAGRDPGMAASDLERLTVDTADQRRAAHAMCRCAHDDPAVDRADVVDVGGEFREVTAGGDPAGLVMIRPAVTQGALVRFVPAPNLLRPGRRIAELTVRALRFADHRWGCAFGAVKRAPDVRRQGD